MKTAIPPHRRAFVALVPAALLIAGPAFAQEAAAPPPAAAAPPVQTTVTPPPVVPTLPQATAGAPASQGETSRNGIGDPNSRTPIAPEALAQAEAARAEAAPRRAPARNARTAAVSRPAPARAEAAPAAPAPVAAAPVTEVPALAPVAAAPADVTPAPVQPAAETQSTAATQTSTVSESAPVWPWIVGGLVILGGLLAFFLMRRRRADEEVYYEESYVEPVAEPIGSPVAAPALIRVETPVVAEQPQYLRAAPVIAPVAAAAVANDEIAPVATEDASLATAEASDVEALTAGDAPVADRPWLEFAMRPVRAGSNVDEALVEIELTIGNAGNIAAEDVRISTFMFADGSASEAEMERLLIERGDDGVAPVTIEPGEGTRVDATLAMLKRDLGDHADFSPVIMADARYRLPDGSEGRTCATFSIGVTDDDGAHIEPISIARPLMREDIAAHLKGVPEHA